MAEGGEKVKTEFEISEEEKKLLHALHLLNIKPSLSSMDDVHKLLHVFGDGKSESHTTHAATTSADYHYPKLSIFFGEEGKGETSWTSFKYEIEALINQKIYSQEQILLGLRRSCKGKAGDKLRRLGTKVNVKEVIDSFDSEYGSVESRETIMKKFYSCQQTDKETVSNYATRLEETFDQAVQKGASNRSDVEILKEVFHAGLRRELKLMSMYQFDKIMSYDELKREIRKLESSLEESDLEEDRAKPCKPAVANSGQNKEIAELKELLMNINERIDKLERDKHTESNQSESYRGRGRGFSGPGQGYTGRGRGFRGGRGQGSRGSRGQGHRGRGGSNDYQPQRPLGGQNFQPTCWSCGVKGHFQRECPSLSNVYCYNCNEPGHKQHTCPKE